MKRTEVLISKIYEQETNTRNLVDEYIRSIFLELKGVKSFEIERNSEYNDNDYYTSYELSTINGIRVRCNGTDIDTEEEIAENAKSVGISSEELLGIYSLLMDRIPNHWLDHISDREISIGEKIV
jgi:hypothetical protein